MVTAVSRWCERCHRLETLKLEDLPCGRTFSMIKAIICMGCGAELPMRRRIHATGHEELKPDKIFIHRDIYDWWRWRCTGSHAVQGVRGVDHNTNTWSHQECIWDAQIHAYHFHGVSL